MKGSSSILIIVIGLLVLWLGLTGKFDCFAGTLTCVTGKAANGGAGTGAGSAAAAAPKAGGLASGHSDALARVFSMLGLLSAEG